MGLVLDADLMALQLYFASESPFRSFLI